MAVRRSTIHPRLEELDALSAHPLRRRSSVSRVAEPMDAAENDDETERLQRRLEKKQLQADKAEQRRSLELSFMSKMSNPQIADGMSQCIKLCAENKINVKNAFSLEMIDFMAYMIKKRKSNLQEASTWLDVSAKIYGCRVDSIHLGTLKMIGTLDKQVKSDGNWDSGLGADYSEPGSDSDVEGKRIQRAKKKKSKQKILASTESLRAPLDLISPASMMIGESDVQTTDMLFQVILPVHANWDLYLHPYDDVILDTVQPEMEADMNNAPVDCLRLERFSHLDLCPSFANFEFLGWSAEEELDLTPEARSQPLVEDNDFQFDLEASLPADDEPGPSGMNYFEMEVDDDENIEVHHSMNMQSVLQRYSEVNIGGGRIVEGCTQESINHSAAVIFDEESSKAAMVKFEIVMHELVRLDRKTMKIAWSEEKLILPSDTDHDHLQCSRYYLRPEVIKKFPQKDETNGTFLPVEFGDYDYNNNENNTMDYCSNIENEDRQADNEENCNNVADFKEDVVDYDYNNNENATRDCWSNIETEDHQADNEENCNNGGDLEEDVASATRSFTGDNLVEAPKMTNRIFIPFLQRAKKIDMRELKRVMWEGLTSTEGEKEHGDVVESSGDNNADKSNGPKKFSDLVKNLPERLTKSNAEALSIPIAFVSLLHLANENNLQIDSSDDRIDLHIRQG